GDHRCRVRHRFHFVAESTAGEVRARRRAHLPLRFVGIARKEHGPLQFFARAKLLAQLPDLLRNKILNFALPRLSFFQSRVVPILCRQGAQKGPRESDVAVRNFQVGIFRVELERVTRLAIGREGDALIITALRIGFVAKIAVELPAVDPRNVRDRKSTRLNSSHLVISYAVFCLKKKKKTKKDLRCRTKETIYYLIHRRKYKSKTERTDAHRITTNGPLAFKPPNTAPNACTTTYT